MAEIEEKAESLARLVELVARLRGPEGCPWDRRQTIPSLARFVLEEAYELTEAIERDDVGGIGEEIGDLLMILLLIARVAEERGDFHIGDAAAAVSHKLIRRHPHVFGDAGARTEREVLLAWESIKREEKPARTSPLDGIPRKAPALFQAYRVAERMARAEGGSRPLPLAKVWEGFHEALGSREREEFERALGAILFALAWEAQERGIDPEAALRATVRAYREDLGPPAEGGPPDGSAEAGR